MNSTPGDSSRNMAVMSANVGSHFPMHAAWRTDTCSRLDRATTPTASRSTAQTPSARTHPRGERLSGTTPSARLGLAPLAETTRVPEVCHYSIMTSATLTRAQRTVPPQTWSKARPAQVPSSPTQRPNGDPPPDLLGVNIDPAAYRMPGAPAYHQPGSDLSLKRPSSSTATTRPLPSSPLRGARWQAKAHTRDR